MNEEELMEAITDAADLCPPIVNCELDNRRAKDIQKLINQQVLSAVAEVRKAGYGFDNGSGFQLQISYKDIEEIERKYRL